MNSNKFILGLIVNPISGMGGSVGLKGTDGKKTLEKAIKLGAKPNALSRTEEFLTELISIKSKLHIITSPKFMGGILLDKMNFEYEIVEDDVFKNYDSIYESTGAYTQTAAKKMIQRDELKLLIFVGGDGTARDIFQAVDKKKPCLGIPAGVKIYSSVFAMNPRTASTLTMNFLWDEIPLKELEVLDIDEEKYRQGKLSSSLYGYLLVPFAPDYTQRSKLGSPSSDLNNQERIAERVVQDLEEDVYYLIGPGTTTKAIADLLEQPKSVLGIDILYNKEIISQDVNESKILDKIEGNTSKIIISPIGRQGFIFGRGNLQFTPDVIKEVGIENIIIISTKHKINSIERQVLRVDTRSKELDKELKGYYRVIVDYDELKICEIK